MTLLDICIITTVLAFVLLSVLVFYAFLASSARTFFSTVRSVKWLNRTAGTVMILAGTVIAVKS